MNLHKSYEMRVKGNKYEHNKDNDQNTDYAHDLGYDHETPGHLNEPSYFK